MPRKRKNSFAVALEAAEKRLNKALDEVMAAKQRVLELNDEIPKLQRIIAALKGGDAHVSINVPKSDLTGEHRAETSAIPEHLAKFVGPQDLSGFGSVRIVTDKPPQPVLTESELLPEPGGIDPLEK